MKLNVGIVGYGKLGKSLEKLISKSKDLNLVKIFSRQKRNNLESYTNIKQYIGKIDIMFLCVGSFNNLEKVALNLVKNFNTIDVYDNHNNLQKHIYNMNNKCLKFKKVAFCALGWDPGIFSLIRGLFSSLNLNYITTWGKGVSQGHTNALKNIEGVKDAVQFTVPNKKITRIFKKGGIVCNNKDFHTRVCYIVADSKNKSRIKNEVINMPDYFKGYKTKIKFVSPQKLNLLKTNEHKGCVISQNNTANFHLNLKSNPDFTAQVMLSYVTAMKSYIKHKNFGAHSIFDIPLKYILLESEYKYL